MADSATAATAARAIAWLVRPALIVLTLFVAIMCVLLLASTLTQTRITSLSVGGVNVNIRKFEDVRQQWSDLRKQISLKSAALENERATQNAISADYQKFQETYTPARTEIDAGLQSYATYVVVFDKQLGTDVADAEHLSPVERLNRIDFAASDLSKSHPETSDKTKEIVGMGTKYRAVDRTRLAFRAKLQAAASLAKDNHFEQDIATLKASLSNIFDSFADKTDAATRARIENSFFELYSDNGLGSFLNAMILAPPDILTLTLVVAMGILGSALQMTHALFVDNRAQTIGAYVLRLSVGAITALVIFIVTKAGVPLVADAARFGGDAPINPFFVSFLAIISGLMSENAIASVESQGMKVFAPSAAETTLRWARNDLHEAFETAGRKPETLRSMLGVDKDQFEDWISGKAEMPADVQKIIAAALGIAPRQLFSDLPPEDGSRPVSKT